MQQIVVHDNLVEQVPGSIIHQRTRSTIMNLPPGIVEFAGLHILYIAFGAQAHGHRTVTRIVVHIAHDDNLHLRVFFLQRFFQRLYLLACKLSVIGSCSTTGPVADNHRHMFASQRTTDRQEATRCVSLVLFQVVDIRDQSHTTHLEECRIIEQTAVHTSTVRTFHMTELEVALLQLRLFTKILQTMPVLHLTDANDGTTDIRQDVSTHFRQHGRHVVQLMLILHFRPLVPSVRQIFIVVLALVVFGIKQVFQIVEAYSVDAIALCLQGCESQCQKHD